jgi:arabinose-5-phosphate isomerase
MANFDKVTTAVEPESLQVARRLLRIEAAAVAQLESRLDDNFKEAVRILTGIRGRVIVSGIGKSGHIARKVSATFASTGTPSSFLHPTEAVHGDLGMVTRDDAALLISKSGTNDDLTDLIPYFKFLDIPIIGVLGDPKSALGARCTVCIDVSVPEEGCPMNLAPTASTTAALAMGDALAVALLTEKQFRSEDFAFLHPGGALGRRLSVKVEDVMHTGDDIPKVEATTPLRDVILVMSKKRLGAACIVDKQNKLTAIFTDGDLRRAFESNSDISKKTVGDLAVRNPKTVGADELAARAINIMERFNILVLPVVDDGGKLIGIVHMHDLLKSGIGK